jgi:hypothetical protein
MNLMLIFIQSMLHFNKTLNMTQWLTYKHKKLF